MELPESVDGVVDESPEQEERRWRQQIVAYLERCVVCLERSPWMAVPSELPGSRESGAVSAELSAQKELLAAPRELSVDDELLPTWILTDGQVAAVERAIEVEQRMRGRAYGG